MKQKLFYIAIIIIILSALFVLLRLIQGSNPKEETKTETTYSTGKTETLYKQGKDSITTKTKSIHNKVILKPSAADSSYIFTKEPASTWSYQGGDSSYKLTINIQPSADGKLLLDYFLNLTTKDLVRIDTIYQLRVDTLKIKETIIQKIDPPFYNTFLFGAIVATAVILLIINIF